MSFPITESRNLGKTVGHRYQSSETLRIATFELLSKISSTILCITQRISKLGLKHGLFSNTTVSKVHTSARKFIHALWINGSTWHITMAK
jgi:hypothetical protein